MGDTTSVGKIGLDLELNSGQFERQMSGIQNIAQHAAGNIVAAFAKKAMSAFVSFGKECIELGSDLSEVQNVVDSVYTTMSDKADTFAKNAAMSYGLSETMAKRYMGTMGAMAKAFGFTEKEALDMSTTLTGLAGDVASFYNITQDAAYTKLKSVFTGETESLKDLGIVMTQSALDSYAMANGFGKVTSAMSEQEKVALRYAFVQSQLTTAAGDFSRTADGWANQMRILTLQFDSFKASIGQGLINAFTPAIKGINFLLSKLITLANVFRSVTSIFNKDAKTGGPVKLKESYDNASSSVTSLGKNAEKSGSKAAKSAKKAADKIKKSMRSVMGFDQINKLSDNSSVDSGSSGGSGGAGGGSAGGVGGGSIPSADMGAVGTAQKMANIKIPPALLKSVEKFKKSLGELGSVIKGGLKWGYDNVLKPLGKWTINKLVPTVLDVLSGAIKVITEVLKALAPLGKWFWDKFLSKLAKFAGDAIIKFLQLLATGLEKFSTWISKHQGTVQTFAVIIGSFIASFLGVHKVVTIAAKFMTVGSKMAGIVKTLGLKFSFFTSPVGIAIVVIGALVAAGILLYKNWDKIKKTSFGKFLIKIGKSVKDLGKWFKTSFHPIESFKNLWEGIKTKKAELEASVKEKVEGALEAFKAGWESIKDRAAELKTEVKEKVTGAIESMKEKWESIKDSDAVKKLQAIKDSAFDTIKSSWESIKDKTSKLKAEVASKWSDISNAWSGIVDNVKDKTAGMYASIKTKWSDISKAWSGVVGNIKDKTAGMYASIKTTTKSLKDGWNNLSKQWKDKVASFSLKFSASAKDLKSWINTNVIERINNAIPKTLKSMGFKVSKLAKGGYVEKNTPQLAMIGDNRHQGEVVAPEGKLKAMADAAAAGAGAGNAEIISLLRQILAAILALNLRVFLDGKDITANTIKRINDITRATGSSPIIV